MIEFCSVCQVELPPGSSIPCIKKPTCRKGKTKFYPAKGSCRMCGSACCVRCLSLDEVCLSCSQERSDK